MSTRIGGNGNFNAFKKGRLKTLRKNGIIITGPHTPPKIVKPMIETPPDSGMRKLAKKALFIVAALALLLCAYGIVGHIESLPM